MDERYAAAEFETLWSTIQAIARMASVIDVEDAEKLLRTALHAQTVGPILEPTAWIRGGSKNIDDQETLARGFLAFRKAIADVTQPTTKG